MSVRKREGAGGRTLHKLNLHAMCNIQLCLLKMSFKCTIIEWKSPKRRNVKIGINRIPIILHELHSTTYIQHTCPIYSDKCSLLLATGSIITNKRIDGYVFRRSTNENEIKNEMERREGNENARQRYAITGTTNVKAYRLSDEAKLLLRTINTFISCCWQIY